MRYYDRLIFELSKKGRTGYSLQVPPVTPERPTPTGDQLLVDGVMIYAEYLELDESVMTGESPTVKKREGDKKIENIERFAFYEKAKKCYAVVATGESAIYANIILKKGVVK